MKFENPVCRWGENVTVRLGTKWATRGCGPVEVATVGGDRVADAKITRCTIKCFKDIEPAEIANEHDPACRTVDGLLAVMRGVYPGFGCEDTVTLVAFTMA